MQLAPQEGAVVLGKYGLFERSGFGHAGLRGQGGGSDVWEGTGPVKAAAFRVTARAVLVGLALVVGAAAPLGCSSSKTARTPRAMLSGSVQAEFDFHAMVKEWARGDAKARIAMESRLIRFQEQFPDDELVRAADALLAWIELERGDLDAAEVHAFRIQIAGPGEVSDIARVVQGSAVRRKGRPDEGLALLAPLEGKVIDGWSRELLNEELTTTAIAAKKWRRAVHYTAVWLREAEPDQHDLVRARIIEALKVTPPAEIARGLESGHRLAELGLPDAELEVRTLYAQRLAQVAKERHDAVLAQKLLGSSGALLGEHGDSIAALASGQGKARVEPRTVGLLLSLRSEETRRRGVDLAAGVAFGLGLPGLAAHLVSRDDGASIRGRRASDGRALGRRRLGRDWRRRRGRVARDGPLRRRSPHPRRAAASRRRARGQVAVRLRRRRGSGRRRSRARDRAGVARRQAGERRRRDHDRARALGRRDHPALRRFSAHLTRASAASSSAPAKGARATRSPRCPRRRFASPPASTRRARRSRRRPSAPAPACSRLRRRQRRCTGCKDGWTRETPRRRGSPRSAATPPCWSSPASRRCPSAAPRIRAR